MKTHMTADQFQKLLSGYGWECSMSRVGECHDNAVMETSFSSPHRFEATEPIDPQRARREHTYEAGR